MSEEINIHEPVPQTYAEMYSKYRGRCKEYVDLWIKEDPTLTAVRGLYWCPILNEEGQHWWTVNQEGDIFDPTKWQWPSYGEGFYTALTDDDALPCAECGKGVPVNQAGKWHHNYVVCSYECYGSLVGFNPSGETHRQQTARMAEALAEMEAKDEKSLSSLIYQAFCAEQEVENDT